MKKHLLFVCSANLDRSPCAESLFENSEEFEAKSCGFFPTADGVKISKKLLDWSDIIFLMENEHQRLFYQKFSKPKNKEIIILNISNNYTRYDKELLELLKSKLRGYLKEKNN